ncbi:ATP/GTP-binding protein [Limibaculum sp. FT325]|uniref:ArgK/MeaB family GTPase n=1 Tax=Thermohalobaculum sediminis TaxID=2939436 RepID=UPI0020C0A715|nr:ATP/GTP-binding protein [Limibaculum sediminis]MCL5776741.1 ATP/GTP-binding protein [Limibaculum sediminis]
MTALAELAARGKAGLAQALAAIEAQGESAAVAALLDEAAASPRGHVLGLTGPPGVGKSTLTDALIHACRARGLTVGVIAVDPSSRISGGALLGDRTRMRRDPEDAGVFVRSMAARDRLGGLADLAYPAAVLMRALMDRVIVETVGVGQSETAVADIADTVVFCAQPGSGDAVQYMKAGVMEIPDIVAVTKADMGAVARRTAADLKGALGLAAGEGGPPPVIAVSALDGEGIDRLLAAIEERAAVPASRLAVRRQVQAQEWLRRHLSERYGQAGLARIAASGALGRAGRSESGPFREARALGEKLDAALDAAFPVVKK